ncbi:MAG: phosphoribosylamine--glycine ligase [Rhizobiales bacterium]|nr:phosphoribosylamine--glycine ligase [Hyphomicrobiales bacterium]NRB14399.1 phosphoribosylamine--glycine ligase [Hyphomicrobiales bacterium]
MNVLVLGGGGREHALCYGIAKSAKLAKLYVAPGNGGTDNVAQSVILDVKNHLEIFEFVEANDIDFVVIGPEDPLVDGLATSLRAAEILCFGPNGDAAQIEGSKGFMKDLCREFNIPTAKYERFKDATNAKLFAAEMDLPIVVKADGLSAGKGVIIAQTIVEADAAIDDIFGGMFGEAGAEVVIEDFMTGEEVSFFALVNGTNVMPMIGAQDHKAVGEGDTGLNTGGMGAYTPAPILDEAMTKRVMDEIIHPTAQAMVKRGIPFEGVLFAGLMITDDGPKLIEYNARFGDPEIQAIMVKLQSDMLELLLATAENRLDELDIKWSNDNVMNVVLAAKGYPLNYDKGTKINNLDAAAAPDNITIFHAGTKNIDGQIVANGGRVLNIVARANSVTEAAKQAYNAIEAIDWADGFCRKDIGHRAIARESTKN